jgi:uncharacterized sulfatase
MGKRIAIGLLAVLVLGAGIGWFNREALLVQLIQWRTAAEFPVGPHQAVTWGQGPDRAPTPDQPPNIIFILADDLGINDLSTFGGGVAGGRVPTPNIDALARGGVSFTQAYAGTASCAPSRAMIMTGRYPTRTGFEFTPTPDGMGSFVARLAGRMGERSGLPPVIYDRAAAEALPPFQTQGLPGSEVTIAEVLRQAGYYTAHIGKWHTGLGPEFGPNAQGFDDALIMASGLHLPKDDPDSVNAPLPFDPIDRFLWARMQHAASFNGGAWFTPGGYLADYYTDEAIAVIRANRGRPFFLNLAHWTVHTPLQATRADYEAVGDITPHRLRVYAAMVRALDRSVGRILAALEAEGLMDNTLIVFSSDNGGAGYIGLDQINAPYRGWKLTFYEGGIRVPLLLHWPARLPAGRQVPGPAAHIDLMPTLAAAAGRPLGPTPVIDGVNLLPAAAGTGPLARPGEVLFWQSGGYRAVRQGDWKLHLLTRPEGVRLYNLATDPQERTDLAAAEPARVAALTALITAHQAGGRPPLYPPTLEAPVALDRTLADRVGPDDAVIYWPN